MKSFIKTIFASTIGVFIGLTIMGFFGLSMLIAIASSGSAEFQLKDDTVFQLDLSGSVSDRNVDNPFASLMGGGKSWSVEDIVSSINKAKENDKVKGMYIKAGMFGCNVADLEPIRKALLDFKSSDKFIVSYSDGYSQGAYYLASVADKVVMNPKGSLDFHGMGGTLMFVRGMYEKMGVKHQVFKVGTFKSAVEPYIQDKMSAANREQTESYISDVWGHLLKGISESRNISVDQLNLYADEFLGFSEADSIVNYGMVDTLMYSTQMDAYLKTLVNVKEDEKLNIATLSNMQSVKAKNSKTHDSKIAILYAEGTILPDEASSGAFMAGASITAKEYVKELQKLKEDKDVKAVVLRVNSPGGSAYASEQIWNAVVELKAVKPVIVSMGTYAASGGYYISCAADTIVAEPTTITGSIGIFGIIPDGTELAKKMGVSFDEVKTNKHGAMGGTTFGIPFLVAAQSRGMNADETRMIQKYIEKGYDLFITRCADGRSMTKEQIDAIGQGRVWTGNQALANGLIDKLGGLDDAIAIAARAAKLDNYSLAKFPAKKDFVAQMLESSLGNAKISAIKMLVGEANYNESIFMQKLQSTDIQLAEMPERISF